MERRFVGNVEKARRFMNLSAEEVAVGAGLPRLAVAHMEYRGRHLRFTEALAIAAFLKLDIAELISEEPLTIRVRIE